MTPTEQARTGSELRTIIVAKDKELARLARYDDLLSAEMPPDFKDWHQNSREEWPEIAAASLRNARKNEQEAWESFDKADLAMRATERQVQRQAETILDYRRRMREAHDFLIAATHQRVVDEWGDRLVEYPEFRRQAERLLTDPTDNPEEGKA